MTNCIWCRYYTQVEGATAIYTIILLKYVCLSAFANGRSQFLLDRLGRCIKLFLSAESISCHEFASQFGLAIFCTRKTLKKFGKIGRIAVCIFQWPCYRLWMPAELAVTAGRRWIALTCTVVATAVCVCVCVLAHACARVRGHACVHDVFAIYDNNSWPRLIMILIKISILYFIQIRHTADFPSTGTRLVYTNDDTRTGLERVTLHCLTVNFRAWRFIQQQWLVMRQTYARNTHFNYITGYQLCLIPWYAKAQ